MAVGVAELRETLARRFPDAVPVTYRTAGAVATGLAALDRVLPGGGLPRGRLTAWASGGGSTALLRSTCAAVVAGGERAAWVDGARVLAGGEWRAGPLLLRPAGGVLALESAEELLRTGGLALVVLSGVEMHGTEEVRLSRAAREGGGAFVLLGGGSAMAALRLSSRILPEGYRWRPGPLGEPAEVDSAVVQLRASALGWSARVELTLPVVPYELRLSVEPGLADRRGSAA